MVAAATPRTARHNATPRCRCIGETVTAVPTSSGSTTTLDRQYFWGLRYVDDLIRRDRDTTGNGVLDETLYALNDRQFNIIALWDPAANSGAGGIVERMAYTPYGTVQFLNEDFTTKANTGYAWTTLFQGLPRDPATGLHDNRGRIYTSLLGRFLQRDPLGYPDGLNAYAAYHVMWAGVDASGKEISTIRYHPNDTTEYYSGEWRVEFDEQGAPVREQISAAWDNKIAFRTVATCKCEKIYTTIYDELVCEDNKQYWRPAKRDLFSEWIAVNIPGSTKKTLVQDYSTLDDDEGGGIEAIPLALLKFIENLTEYIEETQIPLIELTDWETAMRFACLVKCKQLADPTIAIRDLPMVNEDGQGEPNIFRPF